MTITILPATVSSDARTLTSTGLQAFSTDPLNKALENYSSLNPTQRSEYLQWRTERNLDRMTGPGKFWFKAVDSATGDLVGYVGMLAPKKTRPESESSVDGWHASAPANTDLALFAAFVGKLEEMQERLMGRRDDYWCKFRRGMMFGGLANALTAVVSSMAVHPDYQGQGIAKRLLLKGLELADEAGEDVYLESTPGAKGLYLKVGFEVLEEFTVNDRFPMTVMLRKAGSKPSA
jgi:ribosomal protein S18 acetylase RimI-like enzyme